MWWSVHPEFNTGYREVTFILLTVFQQHPDCSYVNGAEVTCSTDHGIARRHGELCVKQIQERAGQAQILQDPNADPADQRSCIGVENKFKVLSTHDDFDQEEVFERSVNGLQLVIGRISHTVNVSTQATGLVAYLQGPNGTLIHPDQGLLLRECTRIASPVPCSHNTDTMKAEGSLRFGPSGNEYWQNFLKAGPLGLSTAERTKISPIESGFPALETYVSLCAVSSSLEARIKCSNSPVANFFSPIIGFPPLIEVAVTPKTTNSSTRFGSGTAMYQASSDPIIFKAFDYDGQAVTVYDQQSSGENQQDRVAKCWSADLSMPRDPLYRCNNPGRPGHEEVCVPGDRGQCVGGTCSLRWPSRMCFAPMPTSRKWCLSDSDCFDAATNRTYECRATWSNCRVGFDVDRNANQRHGNLVKLDYDWTFYSERDNYLPAAERGVDRLDNLPFVKTVSPSFMQHFLHVVDAPFLDVDNPSVWENNRYEDRPGDHIYEGISDGHYGPFTTDGRTARPSFVPAASSLIFSTYACDAGTANQPPRFVTSMEENAPPQGMTEIECPWYETCVVDLYAKDFAMRPDGTESGELTTDRIAIESAFNVKEAIVIAGTEIDCVGRSGRDLGSIHCQWIVRHQENPDGPGYVRAAIGEMISSCFVALDIHAKCNGQRRSACTCRSMPLCVKIKFTGRPPAFVAPTPLTLNSRDDNNLLVPQRTDIQACEGIPIDLTIAASDPDGDQVRIFVYDVDVDALSPAETQHRYLEPGGLYQSDFFASDAVPFGPDAGACGTFKGFGAVKEGDNSEQADIAPSDVTVKSVMSPYRDEIQLAANPTQIIRYTPTVERVQTGDRLAGNGLDVVRWEQCSMAAATAKGEASMVCREKRSNADQVICAYSYDNARAEFKRWVGSTDPNGDDALAWNRDHSNGDLVSQQHCWRIVMQAPPVFVSDNVGVSSPFDRAWLESVLRGLGGFESATRLEAAYKRVRLAVETEYTYTFVAQDPQAHDKIKIYIQEDPGVPRGMRVGPSQCLPRNASAHPMCSPVDSVLDWRSPVDPTVGSECSKAQRSISWKPAAEEAGGAVFKVCLTARDDSRECASIHPDATSAGWYGETQCLLMEVVEPVLAWSPRTDQMLQDGYVMAHVGCESGINFTASDQSVTIGSTAATGNYAVQVSASGSYVLQRAAVLQSQDANPATATATVNWVPQRGEEGLEFQLCGEARDRFGMRALGLTCRGGARDGQPCGGIRSADECGEGRQCAASACVMVRVARCRYCAKAGDSLTAIVREYAMDMNWLRLWALNGNSNPEWGTPVNNPDFIASGSEPQHLFLGVTYRIKSGETLQAIADRFRTTVKSILMLNFDVSDAAAIDRKSVV